MSESDSRVASELLRQSLREGKQPYVTVASNSMLPLLRRGDRIRLAYVSVEELRQGDIVVMGAPADLVVHRYWGFRRKDGEISLLTRGDHLLRFDPLVPAAVLIGRVTKRQRKNRQLDLTGGVGGWLNRRLANIATLEAYLLAITPDPSDTESGKSSINLGAGGPTTILVRLTHKVLYGISFAITFLADILAQTVLSE